METPTISPRPSIGGNAHFYQPLGWIAVAGLIATEFARRSLPLPAAFSPGQTLYWFADHVFFAGKLLALAVLVFVPAKDGLNARFLLAGGGLLLMLGSFLSLSHPLYIAAVAVPFGVALKLAAPSEKMAIVLCIAGLGLGIPLGGFTGLLAVKSKFHPGVMGQLIPATAAVCSISLAAAYVGLYSVLRLRFGR